MPAREVRISIFETWHVLFCLAHLVLQYSFKYRLKNTLVLYFVFLKKIRLRAFSVRRFRSRLSRISSRPVFTAGTPQTFARELVQTPLLLLNNKAFFFFNGLYRGSVLPADFTQVSWLSGQKNLSQSEALIWKDYTMAVPKPPRTCWAGWKWRPRKGDWRVFGWRAVRQGLVVFVTQTINLS